MKDQIYLSDYVLRIDGSFSPNYSASHKDSFLFLADFIGINTGHEFSYVHYSMVANQIDGIIANDPLTPAQNAKLEVLINCDPLVLDILCTIARFQTFDCDALEIRKITNELKGHLGDKVTTALALAKSVLDIDTEPGQTDFSPPAEIKVTPHSNVEQNTVYPGYVQNTFHTN